MRFKKDDKIKNEKKPWKCIICDKDIAVFGELTKKNNHEYVSFDRLFAVSNFNDEDNFEYEIIK